jgi:hypothetical protein
VGVGLTRGGRTLPGWPHITQPSQPDWRGPEASLTSEICLTHITQEVPRAWTKRAWEVSHAGPADKAGSSMAAVRQQYCVLAPISVWLDLVLLVPFSLCILVTDLISDIISSLVTFGHVYACGARQLSRLWLKGSG